MFHNMLCLLVDAIPKRPVALLEICLLLSREQHEENMFMKRIHVPPRTPFYVMKMGLTGVNLISFFAPKHLIVGTR